MTAIAMVAWHGVGVALQGDADLIVAVQQHVPPFFDNVGDHKATATIIRNGDCISADLPDGLSINGGQQEDTLRAIASRLELLVINQIPDLVAVHAGVVDIQGTALVLPGPSMAGKSTMVGALLGRGAIYLSDEFALIDQEGRVRAYPRPMTMRTRSGSERHVPPRAASVDSSPIRVALIAALQFSAAGWNVATASAAIGVLTMMENCVSARHAPSNALAALIPAVQDAVVIAGTRGDAYDAASALLEHMPTSGLR